MNKFDSDYMAGACPQVLNKLEKINLEKIPGYGDDEYSRTAEKKILKQCALKSGRVLFLAGGTLTNLVMLDMMLNSWQGVLAGPLAHISTHESGAVEASGHKVITLPVKGGKISASDISSYMEYYTSSPSSGHIAEPGAVYITQPTELGELYHFNELREISRVCRKFSLRLYIDGARLAYALAADKNDVSLRDIAELSDCFYIGGAKCGALFGEAAVIKEPFSQRNLTCIIKRRGALFSKGWLISSQFDALFSDGVYEKNGEAADKSASEIAAVLKKLGFKFYLPVETNQIFVLLNKTERDAFKKHGVNAEVWDTVNGTEVSRLVTDWTFTKKDVQDFADAAEKVRKEMENGDSNK